MVSQPVASEERFATAPLDRLHEVVGTGLFWPTVASSSEETDAANPIDVIRRAHVLFMSRNSADEGTIEDVLQLRPDAAGLLAWWAEAWRRNEARLLRPVGVYGNDERLHVHAERVKDARVYGEAVIADPESRDDNDLAFAAKSLVDSVRLTDQAPGQRDWRLHVVDDAMMFRAMADAASFGGVSLLTSSEVLTFVGNDPEGYPMLDRFRDLPASLQHLVRSKVAGFLTDRVRYWEHEAFQKHSGRPMGVALSVEIASLQLLTMANEGLSKAFVKGLATKSGTWTVDIEGVRSPAEASGRLHAALFPSPFPEDGLLIQEHVPFHQEQRFFIVGGRVAASTSSDRNLCGLDAVPNRILDPRVATILVPEGEGGYYDRGVTAGRHDRPLSASFARFARKVARDLRSEGIEDYVLDVGLSNSGVHAIELNSLVQAGPYALDRSRQLRAHRRLVTSRTENPSALTGPILRGLVERIETPVAPIDPSDMLSLEVDDKRIIDRCIAAATAGYEPLAAMDFTIDKPSVRLQKGRFVFLLRSDVLVICAGWVDADSNVVLHPVTSPSHGIIPRASIWPILRFTRDGACEDGWRIVFHDGKHSGHVRVEELQDKGSVVHFEVREGSRVVGRRSAQRDDVVSIANEILFDDVDGMHVAGTTRGEGRGAWASWVSMRDSKTMTVSFAQKEARLVWAAVQAEQDEVENREKS